MELLLDRFRASMENKIDWIGYATSLLTVASGYGALYESWAGNWIQISLLIATTVFATVIAYRMIFALIASKSSHPMTNQEFLSAFAKEQEDEESRTAEKISDASVQI